SGLSVAGNGNNTNGGSITLQSNSATTFNVGLNTTKNTNGVKGTLNVAGGTGGTNGSISVTNLGGAVTNSVPFTAVGKLTMVSGGAGSVLVAQNIGSATTNSITLSALGTGSVTSTKTIITNTLNAASVGGSVGSKTAALKFSASNVNVNAPVGAINLSD